MLKFIGILVLVVALATGGYLLYRGLSGNEKNATALTETTHGVVDTMADAIKDGTTEVIKDVSSKATEVKDSATEKVLDKADSIVKSMKEKKDSATNAVKSKAEKSVDTVKSTAKNAKDTVKEKIK